MSDGATVDHKQLHAIFGGYRLDGRAKGTYVQVVYNVDQVATSVGVDGEGFYVENDDLSAVITVTLMQTSDSNDVLSAAWAANRAANGGLARSLAVVDAAGRTVYAAARAKVAKLADATYSDVGEVRVWRFVTTRLEGFVGGNGPTELESTPS